MQLSKKIIYLPKIIPNHPFKKFHISCPQHGVKDYMQRQRNDHYVKLRTKLNYRSRAAFKLLQLDEKYKLIKKSKRIIDLGCAPGAWTQVIFQKATKGTKVIGVDLLDVEPLDVPEGIEYYFIKGDFLDEEIREKIDGITKGKKFDLILSDMAPNLSGIWDNDVYHQMELNRITLEFALEHLEKDGTLITKYFESKYSHEYRKFMKQCFKKTKSYKPDASRKESAEMFLVARERKDVPNELIGSK